MRGFQGRETVAGAVECAADRKPEPALSASRTGLQERSEISFGIGVCWDGLLVFFVFCSERHEQFDAGVGIGVGAGGLFLFQNRAWMRGRVDLLQLPDRH